MGGLCEACVLMMFSLVLGFLFVFLNYAIGFI